MFSLNKINANGISVTLPMNDEAKSIVQFSSNTISSLNDFLFRLKPIVLQVVSLLKQQQPDNITLHVKPSLSFGNEYNEMNYVVSLNHFDIDEILSTLRFNTNNSDGGYFELEIKNPRIYVSDHFRFLSHYSYSSSDSNYDTDESD